MKSPLTTAQRLLSALEELASEETVLLRSLDLFEAVQLAERAAPLIERLCGLLAEAPEIGTLRPRVEALVAQRRRNSAMLDSHLARLQSELRRVEEARKRLARVAPVYGGIAPAPAAPRFNSAA